MNSFEACSTFHVTGFEFGIVESSLAELILGALIRFVRVEMFLGLNLCELPGQLGAIRSPKRVVSIAHRWRFMRCAMQQALLGSSLRAQAR